MLNMQTMQNTESMQAMANNFLHERFEEHAQQLPWQTAVVCNDFQISFSRLNRKANRLARYLQKKGIRKGSPVALYLTHNQDMPLAVLAVLKAGGYYVPLSASYPARRLEAILSDCACNLVLTNTEFPLDGSRTIVNLTYEAFYADLSGDDLHIPLAETDLAYILYTSGTTGVPKGVMINHGNLRYYIEWYVRYLQPQVGGPLPFMSSLSFAACVQQMYVPLVTGSELQIVPTHISQNSALLMEWYRRHPGYGIHIVPTLWEEHLRYIEKAGISAYPKFLLVSGEALKDKLVAETFASCPTMKIWNLYGPTETVANITYGPVLRNEPITIGRVLEGSEVLVVDENKQAVGVGETGELCVSGPGVTPGYYHRDELNRQQFFLVDGKRYYRTGDRVSLVEDGRLIYKGRADRQIKINGIRVELSEIEHAFNEIEGVRESVVLLDASNDYEHDLVAYLLADKEESYRYYVDRLEKRIPRYAMPVRILTFQAYPKLPNGKVNILRLKEMGRADFRSTPNDSAKDTCSRLEEILQKLVRTDRIVRDQNILYQGVNSLAIIKFVNRIQLEFRLPVALGDVYDHPTLCELAAWIDREASAKQPLLQQAMRPARPQGERSLPLAINQKTLWLVDKTKDVRQAYNIIFSIEIEDRHFSFSKLQDALDRLCRENDMLRSLFTTEADSSNPVRKVLENYTPDILQSDAGTEEEREAVIKQYNVNLLKDTRRPHVRYLLFKIEEGHYRLVCIIHHLLFDGYSINIWAKNLLSFYRHTHVAETQPGVDYQTFADRQLAALENGSYAEGVAYWVKKIKSDAYVLNLPLDYPRPAVQQFGGDTVYRFVEEAQKQTWLTFCRQNESSLFVLLLTGYALLLHKESNQDDFLISFPYANRDNYFYENLLGYFVNVILFRTSVGKDDRLIDLLEKSKKSCAEDARYWNCPLEAYFPELNVEVNPSFNPLYQAMFALHDKLLDGVEELTTQSSKTDLFLEVQDCSQGIQFKLNYDTAVFKRSHIERMLHDYLEIVELLCTCPTLRIADFTLVTASEKKRMQQWNQGDGYALRRPATVISLFKEAVSANPERIALRAEDLTFTYEELDYMVDNFAAVLYQKGIRAQQSVGISVLPSTEMLVAILAVMRLGAVYIPLDPNYPQSRIHFIIENSGISYILTDDPGRHFPAAVRQIPVVLDARATSCALPPASALTADDLLYVIYTSGSTGRAKGVMVPNRGVVNCLSWMKAKFQIDTHDVFLYQASINFDISSVEMFLPLLCGASLVITPHEKILTSDLIHQVVDRYRITVLQFVPSALWSFVDTCAVGVKHESLEKVVVGGERLTPELRNIFFRKFDARLINQYGPTEASIYATSHECKRDEMGYVPIGRPLDNVEIYVLDSRFNQVPIGSKGEIYIGGPVLARGYVGMEEETQRRFIYHEGLGKRLFRTGDIGSFRDDGVICFWGRTDSQVKIRGYRIELAEIEKGIVSLPEIDRARLLVHAYTSSDKRILAFYTLKESGRPVAAAAIREHLHQYLPAYMIPSDFICIDRFPLLPNGKVSESELLKNYLSKASPMMEKKNEMPSANGIERKIRLVWEKVLGHSNFSNQDNFFEVGGHSLLILNVQEYFQQVFNRQIPLVDFYKYTSIQSLTHLFTQQDQENITDMVGQIRMRIRKRIRKELI